MNIAQMRLNRSLALTALGRWEEAWREAEYRFALQASTREFMRRVPIERWRGGPLDGTLLVLWEQGLGDMIQYLRFLPFAGALAGRVAFVCHRPLGRLVRESMPEVELIAADEAPRWEHYAAYAPLLSLPFMLRWDGQHLPSEPYLRADRPAARGSTSDMRIGIVWRGSDFDPSRTCTLQDLLPLAQTGARLVNLQLETTADERTLFARHAVEDPMQGAEDFLDTARVLTSVDGVVAIDTSVAHLAGAMGTPLYLLLNTPAAPRWMTGRGDSPWYPSARIFRKPARAAWAQVVAATVAALPEFARRKL